jgi:D-inositol-3-phosphate glycosyltransferase
MSASAGNKPMAVIVGPAHPLRGGLATYNERLARELAQQYQVRILTFSLQYPGFLFPGQTQFSNDPKPDDLDIDVSLNSVNPLNWIRSGLRYRRLAPDLVIFRWWMPFFGPCFGTFARLVRGNKHSRLVAITDNIIPHEKRFFDKPFSRWFLPALHGAVAMSKSVLQDLQEYPLSRKVSKAEYHPHPLYDNFGAGESREEACRALGLDPEYRYLLFFGFIRRYKGLDLLLEAMSLLKDQPHWKLIVSGEFYEEAEPYLAFIKQEGLQNRVLLHTHFIENDDVRHYFCASDCVVQPYRSATQSGVSQIAYHFQTPMIITDVGGLSELVPHQKAGWVCQPHAAAIADSIQAIMKPSVLADIRQHLGELKKGFSWASMVRALQRVAQG